MRDPIFIFYFDMGIKGAAYATVLAQILTLIYVIWVLSRKDKNVIYLHRGIYSLKKQIVKNILIHKLENETGKKASEPTRATSPSKKEPNTHGRPGKIDKDELKELKEAKWSDREIANYFGVKEASVRQAWYRMKNIKTGHCGVYAIYRNSELVYIGSTVRSFTEREFEHRTNLDFWLDKRERRAYVYTLFSKFDEFTFKILEDFGELDATKESSIRQKERELIARYKPIGNVASNPLYKDF